MPEPDSMQTDHEPSFLASNPSTLRRRKRILLLGLLGLLGLPLLLSSWYIVSTVFGKGFLLSQFFGLAALIGWPVTSVLALIALFKGFRELKRIDKGITDPSKRKWAAAGMWLGGFGSILSPLGGVLFLSMMTGVSISDNKDDMINDFNYLFANAYQFRVRPASMAGGDGIYTGYAIPDTLTSYSGAFTVKVIHADTVQFHAQSSLDRASTITVKIGPDGKPIPSSWIYTGKFQQ